MTRRRSRYGYRSRSRAPSSLTTVLTLLAAPVLTVLLLGGLGHLLPEQQGATLSRVFRESPEVLWQLLADLDNHPTWRRELTRLERLPDHDGQPSWIEYRGGEAEAVRLADARAPLRLVTERVAPAGPPPASWTWELAPVEGGSRLTLTRLVRVERPLARAIGFVFQAPRREVERALADLTARLVAAERQRASALHQ